MDISNPGRLNQILPNPADDVSFVTGYSCATHKDWFCLGIWSQHPEIHLYDLP